MVADFSLSPEREGDAGWVVAPNVNMLIGVWKEFAQLSMCSVVGHYRVC